MYQHILVPLENSQTDEVILKHIRALAQMTKARLTLIHVADGFMARNQRRLGESVEMRDDWMYLKRLEEELAGEGFDVKAIMACGDPADNILAAADKEKCDLIAMATHGHRFLSDFILGSVATEVRHKARIPVLLVRDV